MDHTRIKQSIAAAVTRLEILDLSDDELGLDEIEDIVRRSEPLTAAANEKAFGLPLQTVLGGMDTSAFRDWLKNTISKYVKELICGKVYAEIDTPEERAEIVKEYTGKITDAIIAAYPQLALAKPLIRHVVAFILARALARAAENLGEYCSVE